MVVPLLAVPAAGSAGEGLSSCTDERHGSLAQRAAALHALHAVSRRLHDSLDLTDTLDAVAQGVVEVSGFEVAVVNLFLEDGSVEVVALAGSEEVRRELLGRRDPAGPWLAMLNASETWGALRFVDHRSGLDPSIYSWVPDMEVSSDPDGWHPLDALFAPLTSPSGQLIGALCVDVPTSGRRPDAVQRELLEIFAAQAAVAIDHARVYSALKRREAELEHAATHDPLTGLGNRSLLAARLAEVSEPPLQKVAALVLDLDGFKAVNDDFGHAVGDEVLAVIAQRLQGCVRAQDTVARTGGDEFVVLLRGESVERRVAAVLPRLRAALRAPVTTSSGVHELGASIGAAVAGIGETAHELLAIADRRMYEAKREERRRQ